MLVSSFMFIVDMSSPQAVTTRAIVAVTAAVAISRFGFIGSSFWQGFSVEFVEGTVGVVGSRLYRVPVVGVLV